MGGGEGGNKTWKRFVLEVSVTSLLLNFIFEKQEAKMCLMFTGIRIIVN